jgi:predicted outer membrane repeat protein
VPPLRRNLGTFQLTNTQFRNCPRGAISLSNLASGGGTVSVTLTNCVFDNNTSPSNGGGVSLVNVSVPVAFVGTTFTRNQATLDGAAVYMSDNAGDIRFSGGTFTSNAG